MVRNLSKVKEISNREKIIIKTVVSPTILRLLEPVTQYALLFAVQNNVSIVKVLGKDDYYRLKFLWTGLPFKEQIKAKIVDPTYVKYFIETELKEKRPDLYAVFKYNKDSLEWLIKNISDVIKLLEE